MALYNNATNLQGRGNFAPGVTYYAGIKAPTPAAPSLPKNESSFNIDLSSIGNAMIAAKESETKLGMAAIEMEQNMRNAEKDRQLRLKITEMEQAGANERLDKEFATRWQIESMKNDTELQKIAAKKKDSLKDQTKSLANLALSTDEELRGWYIDYSNRKMSPLEWETKLNKKVNEIALRTGANVQDLYTAAGSMGYKTGIGFDAQNNIDDAKKMKEKNFEMIFNVGDKISPNAKTAEEKYQRGVEFLNSVNEVNQVIAYENSPGTTDYEKVALQDIKNKNLDNQINALVIPKLRQVMQDMPRQEDPIAYYTATKMAIANELRSIYPTISPSDINARIDYLSANEGLDKTFERIKQYNKDNSEYAKQTLDFYKDSYNVNIMKKGSNIQKAAVAQNGMPFLQNLSDDQKRSMGEYYMSEMFGNVTENYSWTDEKGNKQNGWRYEDTDGHQVLISSADLLKYQTEHGFSTARGAFLDYSSKVIRSMPKTVESGNILTEDVDKVTRKAYSTLTGNPKLDNDASWMSGDNYHQFVQNIKTCVDSKRCTADDLRNIADSVAKKSNTKPDYDLALQHSAVYKISKSGEDDKQFKQNLNYMSPNNLNGHQIALMTGHTEEEYLKNQNMWDKLQLKDTQMYYQTDKDGNIVIDYSQNGYFKIGTDELRERRNSIAKVLIESGVTPEEQLAFYKMQWPNLVEKKDSEASWYKDFITFAQDKTIGKLAKADTALLSSILDLAKATGLDEETIAELSKDITQAGPKTATRVIGTLATLPYNAVDGLARMVVNETIENKTPKESVVAIENVGNNIVKVNTMLGNWILDRLKAVKEFITEDVPEGIRILRDAYKDWFSFEKVYPSVDVKMEFVGDKK